MTESELMAQFEREYCEQFSCGQVMDGTFVSCDGVYLISRVHVAYVMWKRAKLETQTQWVTITNENWDIPDLGQPVLICINGIVQEYVYRLDQVDNDHGCGEHYWDCEGVGTCPSVEDGDKWMPLPKARR
jgi:hypothetical protein